MLVGRYRLTLRLSEPLLVIVEWALVCPKCVPLHMLRRRGTPLCQQRISGLSLRHIWLMVGTLGGAGAIMCHVVVLRCSRCPPVVCADRLCFHPALRRHRTAPVHPASTVRPPRAGVCAVHVPAAVVCSRWRVMCTRGSHARTVHAAHSARVTVSACTKRLGVTGPTSCSAVATFLTYKSAT
jgi:hypothetical protein